MTARHYKQADAWRGGHEDDKGAATGLDMATQQDAGKLQCSLLLFLATPAEEKGLEEAVTALGFHSSGSGSNESPLGKDYCWLGPVGDETIIAICPVETFMAASLWGRSALWGLQPEQCGAGWPPGLRNRATRHGLCASTPETKTLAMCLYRRRLSHTTIAISGRPLGTGSSIRLWGWVYDRILASQPRAGPAGLVEQFRREQRRGGYAFGVHLRDAVRRRDSKAVSTETIQLECARRRGPDRRGGDGRGGPSRLISTAPDDPIWCVVKGISDFADENRDAVIEENRPIACRNAAEFVLSALLNDAIR